MAVFKCVCSALCLFILSVSAVDGLFSHGVVSCQFTARDGSDAVFLEQYYFNQGLVAQYSSVTGTYTGYTKEAILLAEAFNKDKAIMDKMRKRSYSKCMSRVYIVYDALTNPAGFVKPYVRLRSERPNGSSKHPSLVCSVYHFYPKTIRVTWLRNGQEVTSHVSFTDQLPNGNWTYQTHAYLEHTPIHGEKFTCKVEHASLQEPVLKDWEPAGMPESQRIKIGMGTAGLLAGLMVLLAGFILKRKHIASSMGEETTGVLQQ